MPKDELKLTLDTKAFQKSLAALKKDMRDEGLVEAVTSALELLRGFIMDGIIEQDLIDIGTLLNSWNILVDEVTATSCSGWVGTPLPYAAIHEFGGTIVPKKKKVLAWQDKSGVWHYAHVVRIPARSYLRPALARKDDLQTGFTLTLAAFLTRHGV